MNSAKHIDYLRSKKNRSNITMITVYDYTSANVVEEAKTDILLVGDSLGMTVLGYKSTKEVTMADMVHHVKASSKGAQNSFIVADLPYGSYLSAEKAINNSKKLIDCGAHAVKLEGCMEDVIKALVKNGIHVMGHIGLTPQTAQKNLIRGKSKEDADLLEKQALLLEKAGCFAMVLEALRSDIAKNITKKLSIPTIGIGAGKNCDGQVLVFNDLLGIFDSFKPKFVRRYKMLKKEMIEGCYNFNKDVIRNNYPSDTESYN